MAFAEHHEYHCSQCGLLLVLLSAPPKFGDLECTDCGGVVVVNPPPPPVELIKFSGVAEIEAGAARIRALVREVRERGRRRP